MFLSKKKKKKIAEFLQILAGIYPIAQVREPYTPVGYLAQWLDLPLLLRLQHPEAEGPNDKRERKWSAIDICDGKQNC